MNSRRIIYLLMGYRGMGKDTFANSLEDGSVLDRYKFYTAHGQKITLPGRLFQRLSFAEPLKEHIASSLFVSLSELEDMKRAGDLIEWEGKTYTTREYMIEVGTREREREDSIFARKVKEKIQAYPYDEDVVITDHRFPIEYNYLMDLLRGFGIVRIRIHRQIETPPLHETAEHLLDDTIPDIIAVPKEEPFPMDVYTERFSYWRNSRAIVRQTRPSESVQERKYLKAYVKPQDERTSAYPSPFRYH